MNTMIKNLEKSEWKLTGIEYSGLGDRPYFILSNSKEIKFVPITKGVHNLDDVLKTNT